MLVSRATGQQYPETENTGRCISQEGKVWANLEKTDGR